MGWTPPLEVVQFPGTSASAEDPYWPTAATPLVNGHQAFERAEPTGANPVVRSLTWSAHGWVFILVSLNETAVQQPISAAEMLAVAQGLEVEPARWGDIRPEHPHGF